MKWKLHKIHNYRYYSASPKTCSAAAPPPPFSKGRWGARGRQPRGLVPQSGVICIHVVSASSLRHCNEFIIRTGQARGRGGRKGRSGTRSIRHTDSDSLHQNCLNHQVGKRGGGVWGWSLRKVERCPQLASVVLLGKPSCRASEWAGEWEEHQEAFCG